MSATVEALEEIDAEAVVAYLGKHEQFFVEHAELLEDLRIPHHCGGTISLLEKQVGVLRDKRNSLESKVREFIDVARENERLSRSLHTLAVELMSCDSIDDLLASVRHHLLNDFDCDEVSFLLLDNDEGARSASDPLHFVSPDSKQVAPILRFVQARKTIVTRSNSRQLYALFGDRALKVKSVAMLPLAGGAEYGILAIGSHDQKRLTSDKGTLFLEQMAALISAALGRLLQAA